MTTDPFDRALNAVLLDADPWMPHKEPDQPRTIVGRFMRAGTTADTGYGASKVVTLREENGHEWTVRLYGKVLAREWDEAVPQIGDVVGIRYKGEDQTRDGTTFRNYRVVVIPDDEDQPPSATAPVEPDAPTQPPADEQLELQQRADELAERHRDLAADDDDIPF